MVQILPQARNYTGETIGLAGNALQQVLGQLAHHKADKKLQRAYEESGLNPGLRLLPEAVQKEYLKSIYSQQGTNAFNEALYGGGLPRAQDNQQNSLLEFEQALSHNAPPPEQATQSYLHQGVPQQQQAAPQALNNLQSLLLGGRTPLPPMPQQVQPQQKAPAENQLQRAPIVAPPVVAPIIQAQAAPVAPVARQPQQEMVQQGGLPEFNGKTAAQVRAAAAQTLSPSQQIQLEKLIQAAEERQRPKELTIKEREHKDAILNQADNLEDMIQTTDRMMQALKSGNKPRNDFLAKIQSDYLPSTLDETTDQFIKDSANLINLASQNIKGVPSVFRVKLIEKGKPGIGHTNKVNEQLVADYHSRAKKKLEQLRKLYPKYFEESSEMPKESSEMPKESSEMPDAASNSGRRIQDSNGVIYRSNGSQWIQE